MYPVINDRMINEYEAVDGMKTGRRNQSTLRKPAPVPLFHNKSHMPTPGIEPGLPWWEASS
jgi:hypothetical protein